jgi:outer membrane protein TolC
MALLAFALPAHRAEAQQGLTLQQAVETAQRQGNAAQAATSAREAARWRDRSFSSRLLPQISLIGDLPQITRAIIPVVQPDGTTLFVPNRQQTASLGLGVTQSLPFTGGQLFMRSDLKRVDRYGQEVPRLWQSSPFVIGLEQDVFKPNQYAWDTREQNVRASSAEQQYLEAREDVAVNVANAFFDVFANKATLDNTLANAAVNDTLYTLNKGRFEVGKIGENDLLQSELALLRSRNAVDGARLDYERALATLRTQLGVAPGAELSVTPPVEIPSVAVDTAVAVREALHNRSQIRDLELQDVQARRRVTEAKLNNGFNAKISASVGYNQTASVLDGAYESLAQQQNYRVGLSMPIVQWGYRREQIGAARADQDRLVANARLTRENMAQEARFAAMQLQLAERQVGLAAKADTVASKRFEVAKNRYVIGKIDISNLYIAQSEKDGALVSYVQALRGYWTAYYRLRRLTLYDFVAGERIR